MNHFQWIFPIIASILSGVLISTCLVLETALKQTLKGDVFQVAFIAFASAAIFLIAYGMVTGARFLPTCAEFQAMQWAQIGGGAIRLLYLLLTVFACQRLGAAPATSLIIASQVCFASIIQSTGLFGTAQIDWSWQKSLGLILIISGVTIMMLKKNC